MENMWNDVERLVRRRSPRGLIEQEHLPRTHGVKLMNQDVQSGKILNPKDFVASETALTSEYRLRGCALLSLALFFFFFVG